LAQILSHQASAPGGRELALSSKRNNFIHSAVSLTEIPRYRPNHTAKTVAQFTIELTFAVYRIGRCFAKQKPCQCPDSEVRIILRSHVSNFWKTY
jgi:hypothetical protein